MDMKLAGLNGLQPATPLTRLNYFDGLFLRAELLRREQDGMRSLLFQSNVASGRGITFGLDVTWDKGTVRVQPGLAIDGRGRVLLLVDGISASLADLLSPGGSAPASKAANGGKAAGFQVCAEKLPAPSGGVAAGTSYYAITLCYGELLCGWEEVRGRACEDACDAGVERTYVVDQPTIGLCPITIRRDLPTSTAVALGDQHLRSRVASALFADERDRALSLVSGAGLRTEVWCHGAVVFDEPCGDCVPLALLAVRGQSLSFLDPWIVRRERIETPPRRYWAGRMAMRPWDVYLAQVLQFQCQLAAVLGGLTGAEGSPPGDPCTETRGLLGEALGVLDRMTFSAGPPAEGLPAGSHVVTMPPVAQIATLLKRVRDALAAGPGPRRILVDGGIVELPPAGWLPVDPKSDVAITRQVADLVGPGVDLRFCAVRTDQVPEEFQSCQHMDRISLLHGLDDPAGREQVDILVPDATTVAAPVAGRLFSADVVVSSRAIGPIGDHALLINHALASDTQLPLQGLVRVEARTAGPFAVYAALSGGVASIRTAVDTVEWATNVLRNRAADKVPRWRNAVVSMPRVQTVLQEAAAHRVAVDAGTIDTPVFQSKGAQGDGEPLFVWLEVEADANPFALTPGQSGQLSIRFLYYSPGAGKVLEVTSEGGYTLKGAQPGRQAVVTFTPRSGTFDGTPLTTHTPVDLTIDLETSSLTIKTGPISLTATWTGSPVSARVALTNESGQAAFGAHLAERPQPEASDQYHAHAVSAITGIDQGGGVSDFAANASGKLFPAGSAPSTLSTALDWVLFRRRTRRDCAAGEAPPVPDSTVLVWETVTADPKQAIALGQQLKHGTLDAVWKRVGPVAFSGDTAQLRTPVADLQKAWQLAAGGSQVTAAGYAPVGAIAQPAARDRLRALLRGLPPTAVWVGSDADLNMLANPPNRFVESGDTAVVFLVSLAAPEKTVDLFAVSERELWPTVIKGEVETVRGRTPQGIQPMGQATETADGHWSVDNSLATWARDGADNPRVQLVAWFTAGVGSGEAKQAAAEVADEIVRQIRALSPGSSPSATLVEALPVNFEPGAGDAPIRLFATVQLG